jgi:uncharacterized C2H2 Zn-finger protein
MAGKIKLIPYFRAVQGPDGKWDWAKCPACGEIFKDNKGNVLIGRHWRDKHGDEGAIEI